MTGSAGAAVFLPGDGTFQAVRWFRTGETHAVLIALAGIGKGGRLVRAHRCGGRKEADQENRQHGAMLVLRHRESYSLRS